ncbi:FUSC family protein [Chthonobacter rhizosphaerae]|uniref:FUSC family protein n=1 Tax=Chthonobacter rhizosphaerae TaxID=2735553 RepID=UPI0015EF74FB|nr:FUSC family protein [Chthonobacter rhizosphaerae]
MPHVFPYRHEPVRLAVQTAVGATLAYALGSAIGKDSESWAVFSAVFVISGNVGGTLGIALDRLLGTMIGVLVALAVTHTVGTGGWHTVVSLAIGIGVMALVSGYAPSTSYGLVPTAMLVVAPGFDVLESAIEQSAGIVAGAAAGAFASVVVFPRSAVGEARRAVAEVLRGSAELLDRSLAATLHGERRDLLAVHQSIEAALERARRTNPAARRERRLRGRRSGPVPTDAAAERLWYTLAVLDRLSAQRIPAAVGADLAGRIAAAGRSSAEAIRRIASDTEHGRPPKPTDLSGEVSAVNDALASLRGKPAFTGLDQEDMVHVMTLAFALEEVARHVEALVTPAGDEAAVHPRNVPAQ